MRPGNAIRCADLPRRQCKEKSDILALEPFREALKRETPFAG
jgi:hypothetical protein